MHPRTTPSLQPHSGRRRAPGRIRQHQTGWHHRNHVTVRSLEAAESVRMRHADSAVPSPVAFIARQQPGISPRSKPGTNAAAVNIATDSMPDMVTFAIPHSLRNSTASGAALILEYDTADEPGRHSAAAIPLAPIGIGHTL